MRHTITLILFFIAVVGQAMEHYHVSGKVLTAKGKPLEGASVVVEGTQQGTTTNANGEFQLPHVPKQSKLITASFVGYKPETLENNRDNRGVLVFKLETKAYSLDEIEVFGAIDEQPDKIDMITRMPLRPSEQIQTISVVSERLLEKQSTMTLTDATKNVVGISSFATYGGASESLSLRGFRGVPTLKNGVRVHSDFRGQGTMMDMQGVESIQIIKGSAAVTQGIGNDLGSAAGVVNVATKTPKFYNGGVVSLRLGSWGQVRPTFDVQQVVTKKGDLAVRLNGAFEHGDSYRKHVTKDRVYINPSLEWRPTDRTTFTVEMDYLNDSRTPDRGTVNLAADSVSALYDMPHSKFMGFKSDRVLTENLTYSARMNHKLDDHYSFRLSFSGSSLNTDNTGASVSALKNVGKTGDYHLRSRSLGRSLRDDMNHSLQADFIGQDIYTGKIKHTFQVGFDFKRSAVKTTSYNSVVIDTINVLESISNVLPADVKLNAGTPERTIASSYGVLAQDVITFNKYLKAVLGARYSLSNSVASSSSIAVKGDAFNPIAGIIVTPYKGINLFASYTNTTDLRSASNLMEDGSTIGAATTQQVETGVKSAFFNDRLQVNVTLFNVMNRNMAYALYDDAMQATGRYDKAGDLQRKGIETEISGHITRNLEVVLGYAYLDAQYKKSPAYVEGSSPMGAPKHTANGWAYYSFDEGLLSGLSLGLGAYYTGERPVNDFTQKTTHNNTVPGVKPFDLNAFTTVNASVGYSYRNASLNLVFNNLFNAKGYSTYYRGGFINPIDPFNFAATVAYKF